MRTVPNDKNLVSCCWLYCGACKKYLNNKCNGCHNKEKSPAWCKIRDCCMEKGYQNCALCNEVYTCSIFNGLFIRGLAWICGSDRMRAIEMIKEKGVDGFAKYMADLKIMRIPG